MIRKFITLMMVVAIFTVQAQASTHNGLKAAVDEMTYALTVEWDQKDPEFYESTMNAFRVKVSELQKQGLSNTQLLDLAKAQLKDARLARDLDTAFSVITVNRLSEEEAMNHVVDTMKRSYGKGANWAGDPKITLFIGLIIVAAIAGLILSGIGRNDEDKPETSTTPGTDTTPQISTDICSSYIGYTAFYNCTAGDPALGVSQYCLQRTCVDPSYNYANGYSDGGGN